MRYLLITGAARFSEEQIDEFGRHGFNVLFHQNESEPLNFEPEIIDVVICNNLFAYHDIDLFTNLKLVQLTSAGTDRFPIDKIEGRNIKLLNSAGVYSIPIAEWIVAKILELYKESYFFYKNQMKGVWEKSRTIRELAGQTACIVGFGNIGREAARRLKAFDVEIWAVESRALNSEEAMLATKVYSPNELTDIISEIDIIIISLPLTPATHHMFDKLLLDKVKPEAIIINTSRGAIIDEKELTAKLEQRHISGAALDVFEDEPLVSDSQLWEMNNVIITPHNSFVSNQNSERLFSLCLKNILEYKDE